jgi:hypothetical protein
MVTKPPLSWLYDETARRGCFSCHSKLILIHPGSGLCTFESKYNDILAYIAKKEKN